MRKEAVQSVSNLWRMLSLQQACKGVALGPGLLAAGPYEFMGFGSIDVTKPYEFIWFGVIGAPKPHEFIGSGGFYFANTGRAAGAAGLATSGAGGPSKEKP